MSLVTLPQPIIFPWWNPNAGTFPASTVAITLDAVGDRVGVMFSAPKDGYLDRMEFSLSGTPTGTGNLKVGWQDIDLATAALPTGTFTHWSDFNIASSGWTYTMGSFGSGGRDTGTRKYVNAGDLLAFIISSENLGGTISVPVRHIDYGTTAAHNMCNYPRGLTVLTGTAWAFTADGLACALFYDETIYTPPVFIQKVETAWDSTSTPKTTASFPVQIGDVLVACATAENANATPDVSLGTPTNSGTALTWTLQKRELAATYTEVAIWTATATAAETITVDFTEVNGTDTYRFGGNVLTFRGSSGVGASAGEHAASGEPSTSIVTTQPNSAIVVAIGDQTATDNDDIVWMTSSIIEPAAQTTYFNDPSHYTVYGGYYVDAEIPGAKTVGIAETYTIKYSLAAVEIKGSVTAVVSNPVPFSADVFWPLNGVSTTTISSTAGRKMVGNSFSLPFKCRASGCYLPVDIDADVTVRLYDSDGVTDLLGGACVVDKDIPGAAASAQAIQWVFPTSVVLNANTQYRLVIENSASSTVVTVSTVIVGRDPGWGINYGTAAPGGIDCIFTTTNASHSTVTSGSWIPSVTQRNLMSLIIDQIDDGVTGYGGGAFQAAWAVNANSIVGAGAVQ